jgi:hypothetical protein
MLLDKFPIFPKLFIKMGDLSAKLRISVLVVSGPNTLTYAEGFD